MKTTMKYIKVMYDEPIPVMCDNKSALNIWKNLVVHSRTNHISIWYHFLREKFVEKEVILEYVPKKDQIVNIFTKALSKDDFVYLR